MKVKEILKLAAIFTDQKHLLEDGLFLTSLPEGYQPDYDRETKIFELLDCLNLIYDEIASEYLPPKAKQKVVFENNKLSFDKLEKRLTNVVEIKSLTFGTKLKFKLYPTFIQCKANHAEITYTYAPDKVDINSQLEFYPGAVNARVFAYGVAMEHFFLQAQSTEAFIWENRYKNGLLALMKKHHNIVLPTRRWI